MPEGQEERMAMVDRIDALAAPLCDRIGVELLDVEYEGGVLRLVVDHPDGVGMEAIAGVTREVSRALDHTDPISGSFTLEVSSPGLERPLKRPAHFARAVGSEVSVKTVPGTDGDRRLSGVLASADDDGIVVRVADGSERSLRHDEVLKARTVFTWNPEPKSIRKTARESGGAVTADEKDVWGGNAPEREVGS
ncbi:MAG: ribosome maturation factor RimP [Actinomycetota bacterium]|nr:ribosome maturation factor RimP [Actinomycetota bacterium]MEC9424743.1 ribosome maturation factor RimP [Actinomycetota bacterium]